MPNEKRVFLKSFMHSPKAIGSIIPSSPYLVQSMVNQVKLQKNSKVVELGAGTGVLTETILKESKLNHPLIVFENNNSLKQSLNRFASEITIFDDAFNLKGLLNEQENSIDYIFSGLPLLNFKKEELFNLLDQIDYVLKPGGKFIAFQYTPFLLLYLNAAFDKTSLKVVPLNIPPAFVFVCEKETLT
ncbi:MULTISPECIES: class I SAM-dependent methyltransferase [Bacillaceae]|uniref:Class I SAM-dependent methyltransferase n=1 Tax=Halalkalibacter alkaliphilus TaxID=2917993 RepID=A0A9X2CNH2_9BACI|nr:MULTISPECIES: rRNA adenine N-6-methyltransferase family protein [Bacillaceae]MCL7746668.1 class I SAM-dependent methyltransferase [Halalkalibacter alkaliphilus]MDT8860500.1 class I SAM-dependent methyltransferase [Alkalihalobacillus sp. MEB130]